MRACWHALSLAQIIIRLILRSPPSVGEAGVSKDAGGPAIASQSSGGRHPKLDLSDFGNPEWPDSGKPEAGCASRRAACGRAAQHEGGWMVTQWRLSAE